MKLLRLHLDAFGPFTDRWLDLDGGPAGLHLFCGANEAGKSSTLRALTALRYGIDMRSPDNFVHEHRVMRLGAVLQDTQGRTVQVVRRKGRGQTLSVLGADGSATPASAELEYQLTGGLPRADHDALYGLDSERLRQGGAALLQGEGDVGAALFEASAGVRSLQDILQRLEQEARQHFVPGARGTKGRINEALRHHTEQRAALSAAVLRPVTWAELQRRCEETEQTLRSLLQSQAALEQTLRRGRERQSVAPLLRQLDQALVQCAAHADAPLLPPDATDRRLTLQASLAEHQRALQATQDDLARHQQAWAALPPVSGVVQAAAAIDRLVAEAERTDTVQRALRQADDDRTQLDRQLQTHLAAIDSTCLPETLLTVAPSPVLRAQAQTLLQALDEADRALLQHRQSLATLSAEAPDRVEPSALVPPVRTTSDPLRVALRAACDAVVRAEAALARGEALPAEQAQAGQHLATALADLGLCDAGGPWEVAAVRAVCPVLEVDIDLAVRADDDGHSQQRALEIRLAQIVETLRARREERATLLAHGPVLTVDDVQAARSARDAAWRQSCAAPAEVQHQRQVELAMRQADTLADALLRDAGRSAALHALQRQIADLDRDQHLRQTEINHLQDEQRRRDAAWRARLYQAGLPDAAPASLREWQARLRVARQAADAREALDREAERTAQRVADLSQGLREALRALVPAQPVPQGPLATLLALARHCEAHHAQAEQAAQAHAHAQQQRRETHVQLQREADRLLAARTAAAQAVAEMGRALQLPPGADAVAVRARLQEWADVRAVAEQRALAMHAHAQAERTLADLRDKAHALARTLDLPLPLGADLRHWIDTLARTLSEARAQDSQRQVLAQTLTDTRERAAQHTTVLAQIGRDLQALCDAAGVGSAEALPEAEARARMRREALQQRDQLRQTLAAVSTEDEAHLRQLVAGDIGHQDQDQDQDHSQAQAALREIEQALAVLAPQVEAARQHDEAARRARDAIDAGDAAAQARAAMEQSAATVRASLGPWQRARLAQALLAQALAQFRERAQGPMLRAASDYFASMTAGEYDHLHSEPAEDADHAVLRIRRRDGRHLGVDGLSEGTRDQLYLALRLAALQRHRARGIALPLVLDDVLMTSDDDRAVHLLRTLADFAQGGQVLVFTHHRHLLALAQQHLPASLLACSTL